MITKKHLNHWIEEIEYQRTGIDKELNKKGFEKTNGTVINGDFFSFEYAREKVDTIGQLLYHIKYEMENKT